MQTTIRGFALALSWAALASGVVAQGQPPHLVEHAPGRVMVLVDADTNKSGALDANESFAGVEASLRGTVSRAVGLTASLQVLVVDLPPGMTVEAALAANWKAADARLIAVEPDYVVTASVQPNDPGFPQLWGLRNAADHDIDADEAWDRSTGSSVLVAVVDTGIDYNHLDLRTNMWRNPGEVPGDRIDNDGNGYIDDVHGVNIIGPNRGDPMDDMWHGTHIAGTIGAKGNNGIGVVGVCWNIRLMACKFLNAGGSGYTSDAVTAIQYAVNQGARIINNSWGGSGYNDSLRAAISAAGDRGVLVVCAAGNDRRDTDIVPNYPSGYNLNNIVSVAATTSSDTRAFFSNWGLSSVDLGAPGLDVLSTAPNGSYRLASGTSMASPHVAGTGALLWSVDSALPLATVRQRLIETGDPVAALRGITVSGRRLNARHALDGIGPRMGTRDDVVLIQPGFVLWHFDSDLNGTFDGGFMQLGLEGDQFVGGEPIAAWQDGFDDAAVFRNGTWYIRFSARPGYPNNYVQYSWGLPGDRALIGDFHGEGSDEAAVYQNCPGCPIPALVFDRNRNLAFDSGTDTWQPFRVPVGTQDRLRSGHMNQDRFEDLLIWRGAVGPAMGNFEIYFNRGGTFSEASPDLVVQFGLPGDLPLVGDVNADGFADLMVFRPSEGRLYVNFYEAGAPQSGYGPGGDTDRPILYPNTVGWSVGAVAMDFDRRLESATPQSDCLGDVNGDGGISTDDLLWYLESYELGDSIVDLDGDGGVTVEDLLSYVSHYVNGC